MSSLSIRNDTPTVIDLGDPDKRSAHHPWDADGDGVIDGESLSGEDGKVENANGSEILRARGLTLNPSNALMSVDGFEVSPANAAVVMDFDGSPTLPDDFAGAKSIVGMREHFDWAHNTQGIPDAALLWVQLSTLARSALREMDDWTEMKHASQTAKSAAKKAQIEATEKKIEGERQAALERMAFSIGGAVLGYGVGQAGSVGEAIAKPLAETSSAVGDLVTKTLGGQAKADNQEVQGMRYESIETHMDEAVDSAVASYDDARELFKLALKILDEHAERESQITANVTRG